MNRFFPTPNKRIVEYFKNNVPQSLIANALRISSSLVHNIIKSFTENSEISVRKAQGRRPFLDARGLRALGRHCITHQHDSVIDIPKLAQEYLQKPMSVNTICRAICRCQLKLYHAKWSHMWTWSRSAVVSCGPRLISNGLFKIGKMFYGQTSLNLIFLLEITDTISPRLKRRETFQRVISVQFKSQYLWWYGDALVHTLWAACMFWNALWMLKGI